MWKKPYLAWVVNCPECREPVYITHDPPEESKAVWNIYCSFCGEELEIMLEINNDL